MESKNTRLSTVSVGLGGTLIIVIFVVLCLTIFATLSFSTAYSDLKLAKKTEEMTVDYYAVNAKAEEKLSQVWDISFKSTKKLFITTGEESYNSDAFYNIFTKDISDLEDVSIINDAKENVDFTIYYEVLGQKNQKICVTLNILYDTLSNKSSYKIVSWNLENIELPLYQEENFNLWEGIK
ncbi:MAG: hypothetical protein ACERLG_11270 [Sedimentibacter sp.]